MSKNFGRKKARDGAELLRFHGPFGYLWPKQLMECFISYVQKRDHEKITNGLQC